MKEALICFVVALVLGAIFNSTRDLDVWGTRQNNVMPEVEVPAVNEQMFEDDVLKAKQPVLVAFYSDDEKQSKLMIPLMIAVSKELKDSIKVVRMDAVMSPTICKAYGIEPLPDFVIFKNGRKVDHMLGVTDKDALVSFARLKATRDQVDVAQPADSTEPQPEEPPTISPAAPNSGA